MSRAYLMFVGRFSGDHHWPVLGDRRGWVYQRIDRLSDAIADGEKSFEIGEGIRWERNSAFCKKCIGRIYRMQAEKELDNPKPDRQKVAALLDQSAECLTEAIQRFSRLVEFGSDDPEVGDCYSLIGRTFLVGGKLIEADDAARKAFNLISEGSGKDYLDLLILAGDLQARTRNEEAAENLYTGALEINSDNAEMTEMQARAYLRRGLNRATMKQTQLALSDIDRAATIFRSLGEMSKSNQARWELLRIRNQIPSDAFPLLEAEGYTTRIIALEIYSSQRVNQQSRRNVVGRRAALSSEQWRNIVRQARSRATREEPSW